MTMQQGAIRVAGPIDRPARPRVSGALVLFLVCYALVCLVVLLPRGYLAGTDRPALAALASGPEGQATGRP